MPPSQQQTQKEKRQGRRANPYRRPRLTHFEFFSSQCSQFGSQFGSQFEWTQAQQLHSNTVENKWVNMSSNEFGDNTNNYDDNEKPSIKQNDAMVQPLEQNETVPVIDPELLKWPISIVTNNGNVINDNETDSTEQPDEGSTVILADNVPGTSPGLSGRSRSRKGQRVRRGKGRSDARDQDQFQTTIANTEDVREHPVEEAGSENKRRKITSDKDGDDTIANLATNVDGNEDIVPMEDANNINAIPTMTTESPVPTRGKVRSPRGRSRVRKDQSKRKPRGKRGRPTAISGTVRNDDARGSDQEEQLESMSDVSLVATVPDVPEPEPKSTVVLRKFLESLCANEQILSRDRLLRLGTYLLDYFVSQAWCRPFVNPEDESAVIYRSIITRLMDLTTVEHNLWAGEYDGSASKFYADLAQIMYNAFKFHSEGTIIFIEANLMLACFIELTTKFSKPPHDLSKFDDKLFQVGAKLPHEEFGDVCGVSPSIDSRIYIVPLYSFRQVSRSGNNVAKLPQAAAERLDPMSRPLFDIFGRRNIPPVRFHPTETHCNFARLYITMGAQNIKNCRDERNAILLIVKDVSYVRLENRLRCNVIISKPFGELRELDTIGFPELQDARYWTRVAFLHKTTLDIKVGQKFFDKYLRTPFKVSEYDKELITLSQHEAFLMALNLRQGYSSPEGLSIWQRLVAEANRVKVPIESLESIGKPIQVDAEGFFKRVFHVPGDDKYVVQNFKEISEGTLETRIKEAKNEGRLQYWSNQIRL
ncbi:hypothetical protein C1645_523189 [Glomus cerebriforme]|uniref:Bromo domain-containing protein n=1 Tax=Glomus cerebriforme TaxID=658196 RepID=A0A397TLN8_9GLOM|nr:hypothetical protein C1645_523189 [Glomus cerebriforme]